LSPIELGGMTKWHPFILAMQHAENFAYKKVDAVISMLPKTLKYMKKHGLDEKKWYYIPNGIVVEEWISHKKLNEDTENIIKKIRHNFNKIIAYTGTIGVANALDTFIFAAQKLPNKAFVIVGKGPEKQKLQKITKDLHLKNVFFIQTIDKKEIPALLNKMDILYIGLKYQPLFRFGISPNKLIDYMMSGKPIIMAIEAGNDPVKEANAGISIEPENPQAIADAILKLSEMPKKQLEELGENGQKYVLENHDYTKLSNRFLEILQK
jgi:glycosyltransferase involved in cell wall biosynthesis